MNRICNCARSLVSSFDFAQLRSPGSGSFAGIRLGSDNVECGLPIADLHRSFGISGHGEVAETQGFSPENLATGRNLLLTRCISCHSLVPIGKFSAQRWPELVASMSERASLNETERAQITAYLVAARENLP